MPVFKRTAQAEEDLIEVWMYIAQENVAAAERLLDEIDAKCRLLAEHPRLGAARPDIAPELRYLPISNYLLLYREIDQGIELVRVVHGARRLDQLF
ncbi:plasmid stabilization system [Nitrosococcus halophilus Nc 4]|uniref:Plasmid stabilization system n=1 Tax=Nitrosococcus halophilus (strain Nc4) TaxID=472759 RepID=D5C278_NITHN|nr:type II toxin-antitoxin system RelE/ParE family toxin [Nitrosococcus halophilus]ADE16666.1 plasmid stabilization system [Nitrosococcus halophilus Nc 4]